MEKLYKIFFFSFQLGCRDVIQSTQNAMKDRHVACLQTQPYKWQLISFPKGARDYTQRVYLETGYKSVSDKSYLAHTYLACIISPE